MPDENHFPAWKTSVEAFAWLSLLCVCVLFNANGIGKCENLSQITFTPVSCYSRKSATTARIWIECHQNRNPFAGLHQAKRGKICENVCMSNLISKQIERQQLRPADAAILWPKSERISKQDIRSTSICVCRAEPNRTEPPLMMINAMPLPLEAASSATFSCDDKTFSVFSKYQLDSLETILKSGVPVL